MTTWSSAKGRKVVSIESATTVGILNDLILDPGRHRVAALVLKKTAEKANVLPWASITAFGGDAITVVSEALIVTADEELAELANKAHAAEGKQVLSTDGELVGQVADLDFDEESGEVTALIVKDGEIRADRLLAVGSFAVIVAPLPLG